MSTEIMKVSPIAHPTESNPISVMTRVMDAEELRYHLHENTITARFGMNGVITNLYVRTTERSMFFSVSYNVRTPIKRRDSMLRFINVTNWKLALCNLEMDPEDGEVKLRYTYPLSQEGLSDKTAERLLFSVLGDARGDSAGVMAALTGLDDGMFAEDNDDQS